ncbi:MAG TPA: hypothetical protein VMV69_15205 [Pirellulales bacterium]|nr:hypothetical protein [Pirellulales bacterium]
MRCFACLVLLSCVALSGCSTIRGLDRLSLPESELATTEHLERIVTPGMPIEEARQTLERYGFRCRYEQALGVPYLYGAQVKERNIWPFRATWSATIYHKYGFVTGVRGHYDPAVLERGIVVPPWFPRRFRAAAPKPGDNHAST